jgi:hypothetical protein
VRRRPAQHTRARVTRNRRRREGEEVWESRGLALGCAQQLRLARARRSIWVRDRRMQKPAVRAGGGGEEVGLERSAEERRESEGRRPPVPSRQQHAAGRRAEAAEERQRQNAGAPLRRLELPCTPPAPNSTAAAPSQSAAQLACIGRGARACSALLPGPLVVTPHQPPAWPLDYGAPSSCLDTAAPPGLQRGRGRAKMHLQPGATAASPRALTHRGASGTGSKTSASAAERRARRDLLRLACCCGAEAAC